MTDLDNLSLSFDATDNNEDFIGEVHFENCAYKKIQSMESDVLNYESVISLVLKTDGMENVIFT